MAKLPIKPERLQLNDEQIKKINIGIEMAEKLITIMGRPGGITENNAVVEGYSYVAAVVAKAIYDATKLTDFDNISKVSSESLRRIEIDKKLTIDHLIKTRDTINNIK